MGAWTGELRALAGTAAISGVVFAGWFVAALILVRQAPSLSVPDRAYAAFYTGGHGDLLVTVGLYVVPFTGIAFMWHMAAIRTLVDALPGASSDVPRWLQLGSGVLFVCMLFGGSAAVAAVALLTRLSSTPLPAPEVARTMNSLGYGLLFVFGVRAAGMYMITTTTLARRRAVLPRWVAALGYLGAGFLLVNTTFHPAVLLVLPAVGIATPSRTCPSSTCSRGTRPAGCRSRRSSTCCTRCGRGSTRSPPRPSWTRPPPASPRRCWRRRRGPGTAATPGCAPRTWRAFRPAARCSCSCGRRRSRSRRRRTRTCR